MPGPQINPEPFEVNSAEGDMMLFAVTRTRHETWDELQIKGLPTMYTEPGGDCEGSLKRYLSDVFNVPTHQIRLVVTTKEEPVARSNDGKRTITIQVKVPDHLDHEQIEELWERVQELADDWYKDDDDDDDD